MNKVRRGVWIAAAPLMLVFATDCNLSDAAFGGLAGAACPELMGSADIASATFTADARLNGKIRAFVLASRDLMTVAEQAEAEAAEACLRMGADLGLTPAQMAPRKEPGGRASGACAAVAARIDGILQQGIRIDATVTPPQCRANADARARCQGNCSADVDPGQIVAQCEPARLSGICQGRCNGRCEGSCRGECRGNCMQRDLQGQCAGRCDGECYGACDATCHARCEGNWQAPRCEGYVQGPSADAECNASCDAHAEFTASCTPIGVLVRPSAATQDALRLVATLQANLPKLLHAQLVLGQRLLGNAEVVVQVGQQMPRIVGQAGARAVSCVAAAASGTVRATASIKVTVQASASVSARAGAG